jgi:hypothetical protein
MPIELLAATVVAGMAYVLIPGPATLAALSISASQGPAASAKFLCAHLVGDVIWSHGLGHQNRDGSLCRRVLPRPHMEVAKFQRRASSMLLAAV